MYPISSPGVCTCIMHSLRHLFGCSFIFLFACVYFIQAVPSQCCLSLAPSILYSPRFVSVYMRPFCDSQHSNNSVRCSTLALSPHASCQPIPQEYVPCSESPIFSCRAPRSVMWDHIPTAWGSVGQLRSSANTQTCVEKTSHTENLKKNGVLKRRSHSSWYRKDQSHNIWLCHCPADNAGAVQVHRLPHKLCPAGCVAPGLKSASASKEKQDKEGRPVHSPEASSPFVIARVSTVPSHS